MRVLIAGASGFIGTALSRYLSEQGHLVLSLVRDPKEVDESHFLWDPAKSSVDLNALKNVDAVINLAGENIGQNRWTEEAKKRILDSRIQATHTLANAISRSKSPLKLYIQASAYGYYGDSKDRLCNEDAPQGEGFLASVCAQWEAAAKPIAAQGIRTAIFRFGLVFSSRGGMLAKILPLFRLGLGGKLGSGTQYMTWVHLDDLLSVIQFAITHSSVQGTLNLSAPEPVTNATFTETLSKALHRPAFLPVPAFLLRLVLGSEKANELFLSSTRADSSRLQSFGYKFLYPDIESAIRKCL